MHAPQRRRVWKARASMREVHGGMRFEIEYEAMCEAKVYETTPIQHRRALVTSLQSTPHCFARRAARVHVFVSVS